MAALLRASRLLALMVAAVVADVQKVMPILDMEAKVKQLQNQLQAGTLGASQVPESGNAEGPADTSLTADPAAASVVADPTAELSDPISAAGPASAPAEAPEAEPVAAPEAQPEAAPLVEGATRAPDDPIEIAKVVAKQQEAVDTIMDKLHSDVVGDGNANVPPADAEDPAAAATTFQASTPAALKHLAQAMQLSAQRQKKLADEMSSNKDDAEVQAAAAKKRSAAAGQAETSHNLAHDASFQASQLAIEASIAREKANKAIAAANGQKQAMLQKQNVETQARAFANEKKRKQKKAEVDFETAQMKAKQLKTAAQDADKKASKARTMKNSKDNGRLEAEKEKQAALEEVKRNEAIANEKKLEWQSAVAEADKATTALTQAQKQETELTTVLGERTADAAKAGVQEEVSTKNRELAKQVYDQNQLQAHSLDEAATTAEARAKAAAHNARSLGTEAKEAADKVVAAVQSAQ